MREKGVCKRMGKTLSSLSYVLEKEASFQHEWKMILKTPKGLHAKKCETLYFVQLILDMKRVRV